jgi:hypothetical protein
MRYSLAGRSYCERAHKDHQVAEFASFPLDTTAAGTTSAIHHRAHRKDARFTPAVGEQQCAARMRPPIDADQN